MKWAVIGSGDAGGKIADRLFLLKPWLKQNRDGIEIFPEVNGIPAIFAVNLGKPDLDSLENIPRDDDHRILIGTPGEFHGSGAGKVNVDGARQTELSIDTIVNSVRKHGNIESADAILVIGSTAGGTGSGAVGVIVDAVKRAFGKPVYAMLVLPFKSSYGDADTMVNTATCLRRVLINSRADATILVDNQRFLRDNEPASDNLTAVNDFVANALLDLSSAGQETEAEFIGLVKDAQDIINTLDGPTAIVARYIDLPLSPAPPAEKKGWKNWGKKKDVASTPPPDAHDFAESHEQGERILRVLNMALADLSIDCAGEGDGRLIYPAGKVLAFISGPPSETTTKAVGMIHTILKEKMPDASKISVGTYPGRRSNTLGITLIVSELGGDGAALGKVGMFYTKAVEMMGEVKDKREAQQAKRDALDKLGEDLPSL